MTEAGIVFSNSAQVQRARLFRSRGALILTTLMLLLGAATTVATAQTFSLLYNFGTNSGDPLQPMGLVAQGRDGSLYTTSVYGGTYNLGTVVKITPTGTLTVIYNFDGTHGSEPTGGLTPGTDGNFYGTTWFGGTLGHGTVFKVTPDGTLTTLYNFKNRTDGENPYAAPIQGADGNFYGTTCGCPNGGSFAGTVYKLTPAGKLKTLHQFGRNAFTEGVNPENSLVQGFDGTFYGTTTNQGTHDRGTIFKITAAGKFTALHSFDDPHGSRTNAPLVQGSDGRFYAPAEHGGKFGHGVVYKISPAGKYTPLHSLDDSEGDNSFAGLVLATDGNFYGTAGLGGSTNNGTIYRFSPDRSFSVLYNFDGTTGNQPYVTSLQHTTGIFYGATFAGGAFNEGVFYSFDVGLGPFVRLLPTVRKVGETVGILGQGFTGTTVVSFNGTSANFTIDSDAYLEATVPSGATSGSLTVTTPGGILASNTQFRVMPKILTFNPTSGPVGTPVAITGNSFTQTTRVSFAGVKAAGFTVDSDTQVTAVVPAGAKAGHIQVRTMGGVAVSSGVFQVTQ